MEYYGSGWQGADRSGRVAAKARRVVIVLGICAVAVGGCSVSTPQSETPGAQVAIPPAPVALTAAEYQDKLRSANDTVAPVIERLNSAGSPEDARTALTQASEATSRAAQLMDVNPPAEMLAIHGDLVTALRQLATDLSQYSDQAASMELCAAPSVMATVSNAPGMTSLRSVRDALDSQMVKWGGSLPAATPLPDRRMGNGQLVDSRRRTGSGELKLENGADHDAVVKLVQAGTPIVSVYIEKGSKATVGKINDGAYEIFFTTGEDWDNQLKVFTRSCRFKRFDDLAEFTTRSVRGGIEYTIQTVGLEPIVDGNASVREVPGQSFPR